MCKDIKIHFRIIFVEVKIVGLDLAGKEKNPTGFCLLKIEGKKRSSECWILYKDEEIFIKIEEIKPKVVCIDAPFSYPQKGYFRKCDLELIKKGFRCLSPLFPGVKILVERARNLVRKIKEKDERIEVIEVFPRAAEKILGLEKEKRVNKDKYDALLCAITGEFYLKGNFERIGDEKEGLIVIPK